MNRRAFVHLAASSTVIAPSLKSFAATKPAAGSIHPPDNAFVATLPHLLDLACHGRAMQLVNGVALVARLAKSAEDLGVLLWESAPVTALLRENNQVRGAVISTARGSVRRP